MKKILIVEDDFYINDIYKKAFTSGGYEVEMAADGEEALTKAKNSTHDIILLDIMLPKITGVEVLRKLREAGSNTQNTPIFMTTNLGQEDIIKETFKIGAEGYFIKAQLHPDDLVNEINKFFQDKESIQTK